MSSNSNTFSVNRKPFLVPSYLTVTRSEGYSAFGDAVLAFPMVHSDRSDANNNSSNGGGSSSSPDALDAPSSAAAVAAAATTRSTFGALVVRKYEDVLSRPRALATVTRLLGLQSLALPARLTSTLPIVDAYVDSSRRGDVYLVTPYYPSTLATVLQSGTVLDSRQILYILQHVASAVQMFHAQGIVVGEIRPESIGLQPERLGAGGSVVLLDFTVAHLAEEPVANVLHNLDASAAGVLETTPTQRVETPSRCYRSPEWALELTRTVGTASDMWSIGCLVLELVLRAPLWRDSIDGSSGSCATQSVDYMNKVSQLLGYPANDDFVTNAVAKAAWKSVAATWTPVGLSSLAVQPQEPLLRSFLLLAKRLVVLDPRERMTVDDLLRHPLLLQSAAPPSSTSVGSASAGGTIGGTKEAVAVGAPSAAAGHSNRGGASSPLHRSQSHLAAAAAAAATGAAVSADGGWSDALTGSPSAFDGSSRWAVSPVDTKALVTQLYELVRVVM